MSDDTSNSNILDYLVFDWVDADEGILSDLGSPVVLPSHISVFRQPGWWRSPDPLHAMFALEFVSISRSDDPAEQIFFERWRAVSFDSPITREMLEKLPLIEPLEHPYIEIFRYQDESGQSVLSDARLCVGMLPREYRSMCLDRLAGGVPLLLASFKYMATASRGGDWRDQLIQNMWADTDLLKGFARLVNELWPTWKSIKSNVYWKGEADANRRQEWVSDMWERDEIKLFAAKHPKFTRDLLSRTVDYGEKAANRRAQPLACFHAALEFQINIKGETLSIVDVYSRYGRRVLSPSTLVTYYKKGASLLKPPE